MRAWLRLLRVPNLATAAADVLAGFLVVAGLRAVEMPPAACWFALVAGLCFYAGGVVLNDVCDVDLDRRERPERPLPAATISVRAAANLAKALLAVGAAAACGAAFAARSPWPALVGAGLTAAIWLYDRHAKGTPLGPVVMGTCRGLAWLLGMTAAGGPTATHQWAIPAGMATYVAGITILARDEAGRSRTGTLLAGAAVMAAGLALAAGFVWLPMRLDATVAGRPLAVNTWLALWSVIAGSIVLRGVVAILDPAPARVRAAVGNAIMSIITLDAILVLAACGEQWAVVVLLLLGGFVLGRQLVPPT
ncbi:MAG: UbiA family prenyltransferase [Planctomycetaceae bacterium]